MSSKPKKILLLGAGFTTRNMGVWALASGAITSAWHAYPDAQIYLLDYYTTPANYKVKHPGGTGVVQLLNMRFSKKFWLPNNILRLLLSTLLIRLVPSRSLQDRLLSRNIWLCHIQTADIISSIAGGDSFSDIYGAVRLIYVTLPQLLVLLLGKQLVLLPQTIGPFKGSFSKIVAKYILKHARMI
jgi:colanic acid/amylovoran biosynthesis protein